MEWVETPGKGRNASALLEEFEERFARLSALDRTMLDTSCVLLFVKVMDARDRDQVSLLLETEDGLTTNWAVVKRFCSRFDKRREWGEEGSLAARHILTRKFDESSLTRKEETRSWLETGSTLSGVAKGPSEGAALEELTKMVRDLQMAHARRDSGKQSRDGKLAAGQRYICRSRPERLRGFRRTAQDQHGVPLE